MIRAHCCGRKVERLWGGARSVSVLQISFRTAAAESQSYCVRESCARPDAQTVVRFPLASPASCASAGSVGVSSLARQRGQRSIWRLLLQCSFHPKHALAAQHGRSPPSLFSLPFWISPPSLQSKPSPAQSPGAGSVGPRCQPLSTFHSSPALRCRHCHHPSSVTVPHLSMRACTCLLPSPSLRFALPRRAKRAPSSEHWEGTRVWYLFCF